MKEGEGQKGLIVIKYIDDPETDRQTEKETDLQTDRQTNKQTDRQTDRQTENWKPDNVHPTRLAVTCSSIMSMNSSREGGKSGKRLTHGRRKRGSKRFFFFK